MLYYIILYYIILYYIILYYIILYYNIILYYTTLYYIILHYIILYYIILYYTTLYYIILHYIILYRCHDTPEKQTRLDKCKCYDQEGSNAFLLLAMGVGGRQILGGCKRSVNFLPEFPIVLSENFPE